MPDDPQFWLSSNSRAIYGMFADDKPILCSALSSEGCHVWYEPTLVPDNSRTVVVRLADGTEVEAFYWRPERCWYAKDGGKRQQDAIEPTEWRERSME